jgi:excisionase family DNA binding protein
VAIRLGVSQATVLRAVARGILKPALTTRGGHRRFHAEAVDALARALRPHVGGDVRLISTGQVARLLGVSQPTVVRAVREGRLQPDETTPGGHHRFVEARIRELAPFTSELVGTSGAARALGLTVQKVLRAVHQGQLSPVAITPGGHRRFAASHLSNHGGERSIGPVLNAQPVRQAGPDGWGHAGG